MEIDVPAGYNVYRFGGALIIPGTVIHLRRDADNAWCSGTVQPDGTLVITEDPR